MNVFTKIVLRFGKIKFTKKRIEILFEENNIKLLKIPLLNANYKGQVQVIKGFVERKDSSIIPILMLIAKKINKKLALEAIKAIEVLDVNLMFTKKIETLKEFWQFKEDRVLSFKQINFKKNSMKNLEKVRQQLKRPMIGGKWF